MGEFINTIDTLGDADVSKAFIEGALTEFNDDAMRNLSDYAFYQYDSLENVNFSNLTNVGEFSFSNCSSLQSANLPNVTNIGRGAFSKCSKLKRLILPKIKTGSSQMCSHCYALKEVDFRKMTGCDSDTFLQASSLTTIVLGSESVFTLSSVDIFKDTNFSTGKSGGTLIVPRHLISEYQNDANWAYILSANPNNRILALDDCTIDESTVGDMDWANMSLSRAILQGTLREVDNDEITSVTSYMFSGNDKLRCVNLPNLINAGNYAFSNCTKLTSVRLDSIAVLSESMFRECTKLTNLYLPKVTKLSQNVFYGCQILNNIDLPTCTSIGDFAFQNCYTLKNVNSPLLITVGRYVFSSCYNLQSMSLINVTSIGKQAFINCTSLSSVKLPSTPPTVSSDSFKNINVKCVFYVPTGSLEAYQTDSNWSAYTTEYSFVEEDR